MADTQIVYDMIEAETVTGTPEYNRPVNMYGPEIW